MEQSTGKKLNKKALFLALTAALLVCAAAVVLLFTVRIGSRLYRRAELIDARAAALSCADYDAAAAKLPGSVIRWSVPIGPDRFDSFSETIVLSALPEEEIGRLAYFPDLKTVDARACADYAALAAAASEREDLRFLWTVPSSDGAIDGGAEALSVRACGGDELAKLLPLLPRLRKLDLTQSALSDAEIDALAAAFPALALRYTVHIGDLALPSDSRSLTADASAAGDTAALKAALGRLKELEQVDLRGVAFSADELAELLPLCPADTLYEVPLCGARYDRDCEEIDISGVSVADPGEIDAAVELLPRLKKLVMCDCGLSDDEMAALGERHPQTRFIWTVRFSVYTLRTDVTAFCASDLPSHGYVAPHLSSEELSPLRYCTDLIALDLGHMFFDDLSFLENLTKLKYLIIVEERFRDISVLGRLEDLEYLEIFNNTIDDISPLLNCRKLRHLNIGYTRGYDPSPLWEMTWLERLWYPGNRMGKEACAELENALPDTHCYLISYDKNGSTGAGWRTDAAYFEMRNLFGMFYQPGGTGTEQLG